MPSTIHSVKNFLQQQILKNIHRKTLNAYKKQNFEYIHATISLGDALEHKLLKPHHLIGPKSRLPYSFIEFDSRVWEAWNEASRGIFEICKQEYGDTQDTFNTGHARYCNALNIEASIEHAADNNNLDFLVWIHEHPSPWRAFEWSGEKILTQHPRIGHWALDQFKEFGFLDTIPASIIQDMLNSDTPYSTRTTMYTFAWNYTKNSDAYLLASEGYIKRIADHFLPLDQWPWTKRWFEIIQPAMPYHIHTSSLRVNSEEQQSEQREVYFKGRLVAEMLHEAPLDIQMLICAFKNTIHPQEDPVGHPQPKMIRERFFNGPPPNTMCDTGQLSALLFCMDTYDPDVAAYAIIPLISQPPNEKPSLDVDSDLFV